MTPSTRLKLSAIGQIEFLVSNIVRAQAFYRDVLGLPFLFAAQPKLAFFQAGTVRLMLAEPTNGETARNSTIYFKVEDIAAMHADLIAHGAASEHSPALMAKMPDHDLWMAFIRDPDQNRIGLMEERAR